MREIKFRVWNKPANFMVVDAHMRTDFGPMCESMDMVMEQYTGLLDRNGVEIYEGDVIRLSFGIPPTSIRGVVEWCENEYVGDAGVACSGWWIRGIDGAKSAPLCTCYENDIEVIGNIHQHPELLEG